MIYGKIKTCIFINSREKLRQDLNESIGSESTNFTLPVDYETDTLRAELTQFGETVGPITKSTKKLYLKRLIKYKRNPEKMTQIRNESCQKSSKLISNIFFLQYT